MSKQWTPPSWLQSTQLQLSRHLQQKNSIGRPNQTIHRTHLAKWTGALGVQSHPERIGVKLKSRDSSNIRKCKEG
eukprot:14682174-Ditylum_brightwellii.AAC.1